MLWVGTGPSVAVLDSPVNGPPDELPDAPLTHRISVITPITPKIATPKIAQVQLGAGNAVSSRRRRLRSRAEPCLADRRGATGSTGSAGVAYQCDGGVSRRLGGWSLKVNSSNQRSTI